jgi:hypothetical protein
VVVNHGTVIYVDEGRLDRINLVRYYLMPISGVGVPGAYFLKTRKKHNAKNSCS